MIIYSNWANAELNAGDPKSALKYLDRALGIARKRGVHNDEAAIYALHANQFYQLARYDDALRDYETAGASAEKNHNAVITALAKQGKAKTLLELGRTAEAEQLLAQADKMIGDTIPTEGSVAENSILLNGLFALEKHHCADAIAQLSRNIDSMLANNERISKLSYALYLRGQAHLCEDNSTAAAADGKQAYEIAQSLRGQSGYSKNVGEAALLLATAASKQNESAQAREWAGVAYQQLQRSLGEEHPTTLAAKKLLQG
jgi:tetratricopeptide (TPR) repeat protein